eukprot:jgi/Tetstr1/463454/TSEL_008347.t1
MARTYADLHEELRVLTYNPITINTSTQRRKRRRGAQTATTTAEHSNEAFSEAYRHEGGQGVAIPLENEDTTRREFDSRPENLVVMDNTANNPDAYREEGLLGDWENTYLVAYCHYDFRGTKLTAVTSMKGVSEIKDSRHKNLVVRRPLAKLRHTMQLQEEANGECNASLPLDGIRHMEITYELARLRAALNVHTLDVDNKRKWFNDHRFNVDEKKDEFKDRVPDAKLSLPAFNVVTMSYMIRGA